MSRKIYLPVLGIWEDIDDVTLLNDVPRVVNGHLIAPPNWAAPTMGQAFVPMTYIWQFAASCATAANVVVSRTLNGVTSAISTIAVPAGGTGVDAFEREYNATYSWSADVSNVSVEII